MMENAFSRERERPAKRAYAWDVPGRKVSIGVDFDVVDRLGDLVSQGFEAGPRRGLEVGGILLGSAVAGEKLTAQIEDFEPVPVSYQTGPGYQLEGADRSRFEEALRRWMPGPGRRMCAIGFYRSSSRDDLAIDQHDRDLLDRYFPGDTGIALVVRPSANQPPAAGIFFREDGQFRENSAQHEFPFRRRELGGGSTPHKTMSTLTHHENAGARALSPEDRGNSEGRGEKHDEKESPVIGNGTTHDAAADAAGSGNQVLGLNTPPPAPATGGPTSPESGADTSRVPSRTLRLRGGWVWIPVSCIFLLVGTILGFQVALSVQSKVSPGPQVDPYTLNLTATPSADSVHLRWDRNAPAIRKAQRGVLVINESGQEKNVDLDAGHLRNGSVIYRRLSSDVRFRLEIYMKQRVSISETVEFRPVTLNDSADSGGV